MSGIVNPYPATGSSWRAGAGSGKRRCMPQEVMSLDTDRQGAVGASEDMDAGVTPVGASAELIGEVSEDFGRSPWQLFWRRFRDDKLALASLGFIVFLVIIAIFAPLICSLSARPTPTTATPAALDPVFATPTGPSSDHWFGVDQLGRDVLARTVYGARVSLIVAFVATFLATVFGIIAGLLAGYYRAGSTRSSPAASTCCSRSPICCWRPASPPPARSARGSGGGSGCLGGLIKPGLGVVIFVIAFTSWTYMARIIRGQVLSLREKEFIEASRAIGATNSRIIFRELLPNLIAPIIVYASILIPQVILYEAALSFLGVGVSRRPAELGPDDLRGDARSSPPPGGTCSSPASRSSSPCSPSTSSATRCRTRSTRARAARASASASRRRRPPRRKRRSRQLDGIKANRAQGPTHESKGRVMRRRLLRALIPGMLLIVARSYSPPVAAIQRFEQRRRGASEVRGAHGGAERRPAGWRPDGDRGQRRRLHRPRRAVLPVHLHGQRGHAVGPGRLGARRRRAAHAAARDRGPTVSEDGKTITYTLRDDVKYSPPVDRAGDRGRRQVRDRALAAARRPERIRRRRTCPASWASTRRSRRLRTTRPGARLTSAGSGAPTTRRSRSSSPTRRRSASWCSVPPGQRTGSGGVREGVRRARTRRPTVRTRSRPVRT